MEHTTENRNLVTYIKLLKQLLTVNEFDTTSSHNSFLKLKPNVIKTLSETDLKRWIISAIVHHVMNTEFYILNIINRLIQFTTKSDLKTVM